MRIDSSRMFMAFTAHIFRNRTATSAMEWALFLWNVPEQFITRYGQTAFSRNQSIPLATAGRADSSATTVIWTYLGGRIMFINTIIAGAIVMASLTIALFFLRFWKSTHDRFFLFFATSFALEAINRILIQITIHQDEQQPLFYLIRLVAYGLILVAILQKNRRPTGTKRRP